MGDYGVTCNAYAPIAATRMSTGEEAQARYKKKYELGLYSKERYEEVTHPPSPETVPPLIVYLCLDKAAGINGQVFSIRGEIIGIYSKPKITKAIRKETGLWTIDELIELVPKELLGK
jgi:hypothetical protein